MPKHMLSARQAQVAREGDTHDGEGLILLGSDTRRSFAHTPKRTWRQGNVDHRFDLGAVSHVLANEGYLITAQVLDGYQIGVECRNRMSFHDKHRTAVLAFVRKRFSSSYMAYCTIPLTVRSTH